MHRMMSGIVMLTLSFTLQAASFEDLRRSCHAQKARSSFQLLCLEKQRFVVPARIVQKPLHSSTTIAFKAILKDGKFSSGWQQAKRRHTQFVGATVYEGWEASVRLSANLDCDEILKFADEARLCRSKLEPLWESCGDLRNLELAEGSPCQLRTTGERFGPEGLMN